MTGILHGTCKCCEEVVCCCGPGAWDCCEIDLANISLVFSCQMYKSTYQWHCDDRRCQQDGPGRCGNCDGTFPWTDADSDTVGIWDSDEGGCTFPQTLTPILYPPICELQDGNDYACDDESDGCPRDKLGIIHPLCVAVIQEDFSVTFNWDSDWRYGYDGFLYGLAEADYYTYVDNNNAGEGLITCSSTGDDKKQCCDDPIATTCKCPMEVKIDCHTGEVILHCAPAADGGCESASNCYSECGEGDNSTCCMDIGSTRVCCEACYDGWLFNPPNETWPSVATDCPERFDSQNGGIRKRYLMKDGWYGIPAGCFVTANFRRIVGNFNLKGSVSDDCN